MAKKGEVNCITCDTCGETYPATVINFRKYSKAVSGSWFHTTCRLCEDIEKEDAEWKDGKLLCHICGQYLPPESFQKHKFYAHRSHHECRCRKCKAAQNKQARQSYGNNTALTKLLQERWLAAKLRASNKKLPFNITKEYLKQLWEKQKGLCAISGIPMTYQFDSGRINTNVSIDQINPSQGYIIGSVQLVCMAVNQMKSDLSIEELYMFCEAILKNKK